MLLKQEGGLTRQGAFSALTIARSYPSLPVPSVCAHQRSDVAREALPGLISQSVVAVQSLVVLQSSAGLLLDRYC